MTTLTMVVHHTDHSTRTTHFHDDPVGRVRADKSAFANMARSDVAYVIVKRTERREQG